MVIETHTVVFGTIAGEPQVNRLAAKMTHASKHIASFGTLMCLGSNVVTQTTDGLKHVHNTSHRNTIHIV